MENVRASMSTPSTKAFIPVRRTALADALITDGGAHAPLLAELAGLLDAVFHAEARFRLETLKTTYAAFDPDVAARSPADASPDALEHVLTDVLTRANFTALSDDEVRASVFSEGIFPVSYDVDFGRLLRFQVWVRGAGTEEAVRAKFFGLRRETVRFDVYRRVFLALTFRAPLQSRWRALVHRLFPPLLEHVHQPGRTYLKLIRNVPQKDLEIVFPDPVPRMKNSQILQTAVPFVVGVGLMLWEWVLKPLVDGERHAAASEAAITAVAIALGGHAFKTWQGYREAVKEFLNEVTHSLYFRSVALNGGVMQWVVDAAEEEDAKETLLALAALLDGPKDGEDVSRRGTELARHALGIDVPELSLSEGLAHLARMDLVDEKAGLWSAHAPAEMRERLFAQVLRTITRS